MMLLPWRPVLLAGGPVPAISTSVTLAETAELQQLVRQTCGCEGGQPATTINVLEVGSAFGYSAIALALAGAQVTAVDPHAGELPNSLEVMRANLAAYEVADRVRMLVGTSQEVLPTLEPGSFDLAFIDADHTEPAVLHDVEWTLKLLRPGGVLACHDLDEGTCPGVRAALDRLFGHPQPTVDTLFVHQT